MMPEECVEIDCRCFSMDGIKQILKIHKEYKYCRSELRSSRKWINDHKASDFSQLSWYQHEYAIIGGITFSFLLGGLLFLGVSK
jgi:hypothetical protein